MHIGRRDDMVDGRGIFAGEGNPVMRHIDADDGVVAGNSAVLDQSGSAADLNLVAARPAIEGVAPAAADYQIVAATAVDRNGAVTALGRIVAVAAEDQVGDSSTL